MMVFGTGTMVASKFMLAEKPKDSDGNDSDFEKALYQSFIMFLAMSLCYPIHLCVQTIKKFFNKNSGEVQMELSPEEKQAKRWETIKVLRLFLFIFETPHLFRVIALFVLLPSAI